MDHWDVPTRIAALTFVILVGQLVVFALQLRVFKDQAETSGSQVQLQAELARLAASESETKTTEALAAFYELGLAIADHLRKADRKHGNPASIEGELEPHVQLLLTSELRGFARLGAATLKKLLRVQIDMSGYRIAVHNYNASQGSSDQEAAMLKLLAVRSAIGRDLDKANKAIPDSLRWKNAAGEEWDFIGLCEDGGVNRLVAEVRQKQLGGHSDAGGSGS